MWIWEILSKEGEKEFGNCILKIPWGGEKCQ